ncbi:Hypothetical protein CAP_5304 [Chondromyces apiculatus DSM 436]|uniref:Uncharacterized protein n=1 Tax=Chondromyces apiculatus DSM 436 TaxID=1192034 RepID=A0A017T386_9BACT|nr:Hypothetical protein CAP_5304 [Chondromyces apiculatus DSM 436]
MVIEDTDQNGRFTVEIAAEPCDLVLISQEVITDDGLETSPHNSFLIEERDSTGVIGEGCP